MTLSLSEQFLYVTTLIEGDAGQGTGFFFEFKLQPGGERVPCLVTNRHVIEDQDEATIHVSMAEDGVIVPGGHIAVQYYDFESQFLKHPNVDIAVMPLTGLQERYIDERRQPFWICLTDALIPDNAFINSLGPIENVLMIGYPGGRWDEANNSPIFRRGITASPYARDWKRKPEFLIDCGSFPGNSGSPVFIADFGGYLDKNFNYNMGKSRLKLLGILWGGSYRSYPVTDGIGMDGDITGEVRVPMHLPICAKAQEMRWFERHLAAFIANASPSTIQEPDPSDDSDPSDIDQ